MWAVQFRPPSPPLRARTPPPTPPQPLQIALPSAPQYPFIQDRHTFLANWQTPAIPPPSIISSDSLNSLRSAFSNTNNPMMVAGDDIRVHPGQWTQWDQLLCILFHLGKKHGTMASGLPSVYRHCPRIPSYWHSYACLATWTPQNGCSIWFDQIETRISIHLQDLSLHDSFYAPATPTMLGVIDQMLWHKEGYQITSVGTHVYSPSGYNVQFEGFVLSPLPFPLSTQPFISPGLSREHLARRSSMTKFTLLLRIGEGWDWVGEYVM